jgi:DNA-binding response OmpR family regulator
VSLGSVLVVEDDSTNRMLITQILKRRGYDAVAASNGRAALELLRDFKPNVVVSDIQMPELSGTQLLSAIRQHPDMGTLPVILLSSLAERSQVRGGMVAGADDYLTKPFKPEELIDAVQAQLNKTELQGQAQERALQSALDVALQAQKHNLSAVDEKRLKRELSEQVWASSAAPTGQDQHLAEATVLYVDLISRDWPRQFLPVDLADVLKAAYANALDTLGLFSAHTIHMVGEGLVVVFTPEHDSRSVNHALRALRSALAMSKASQRVEQHLQKRFPGRRFAPFELSAAMHSGPVGIARITDPSRPNQPFGLPVGESVNLVRRLQEKAASAKCGLLVSEAAIQLLPKNLKIGRQAQVRLDATGRATKVVEVLGLRETQQTAQTA